MAADPTLGLVIELVAAVDRDLAAYRSAEMSDPNRLNAGRSALHGLESAANRLIEVRATLLRDLGGTYGEWDRPDIPGPGRNDNPAGNADAP